MSAVRSRSALLAASLLLIAPFATVPVHGHGDVAPQAVDIAGLPKLGKKWLEENPWRDPKGKHWARAVEVGASGYNQNCARCHGLGGVSGGLAPDLRFLEANIDGDEWYLERYKLGYTQNGITKMPAFGDLLGQEAAWAIRTYIETRPDADSLGQHVTTLKSLRDQLKTLVGAKKPVAELKKVTPGIRSALAEIAAKVETGSGAPVADSVASKAANLLDGSAAGTKAAAEALTIGLSAAK